jgi:uroporphyrinogen-III synthase
VRGLGARFPDGLTLVAVGPATARALNDAGYEDVLCADSPFNSEAVLELPQLRRVAGARIVIFRGGDGRGLLAQVLRERGAEVEYAEAYRRASPPPPSAEVAAALRRGQVEAVTATSGQTLEQLVEMCSGGLHRGLLRAQLVVSSDRMVKLAESLGFRMPLVAAEPGDRALVEALVAWRTGQPPQEIGHHP